MKRLFCYRVWFRDGAALLVDAETRLLAANQARKLAEQQGGDLYIDRIEKLTASGISSSAD